MWLQQRMRIAVLGKLFTSVERRDGCWYSEADNVLRTPWLWVRNVGLKLKTMLVDRLVLSSVARRDAEEEKTLL